MNGVELAEAFAKIVALVRLADDPVSCWSGILDITGQSSNEKLRSIDVRGDIAFVSEQIRRVLDVAPVPTGIRYFYFGLFDQLLEGREVAGYYVSGGSGDHAEKELAEGGRPQYFPPRRYLRSTILNVVKEEVLRLRQSTQTYAASELFDYAVMFGAAALLTKFAALSLGVRLPIYLGFDSGDFARITD